MGFQASAVPLTICLKGLTMAFPITHPGAQVKVADARQKK